MQKLSENYENTRNEMIGFIEVDKVSSFVQELNKRLGKIERRTTDLHASYSIKKVITDLNKVVDNYKGENYARNEQETVESEPLNPS